MNYLYYNQNYACPTNHWCPGLQKTLCSAQKPITYTQTLGLNECPESHPYAPAKSTTQSDCYNQCPDVQIVNGMRIATNNIVHYPDECEYQTICAAGYGLTSNNECEQLCNVAKKLHAGNYAFNLYANKTTSPTLGIKNKGQVCYVNLAPGHVSHTLNIKFNNATFHATD